MHVKNFVGVRNNKIGEYFHNTLQLHLVKFLPSKNFLLDSSSNLINTELLTIRHKKIIKWVIVLNLYQLEHANDCYVFYICLYIRTYHMLYRLL